MATGTGHGGRKKARGQERGTWSKITVRFLPPSRHLPTSAHHASLGLPSVPFSLRPAARTLQLSSTPPGVWLAGWAAGLQSPGAGAMVLS